MDTKKIISELKELISNDFEHRLLDAAFSNLNDEGNILRFNNFSYSIRELSRHILYSLAPNRQVLECSWYKNEIPEKENGITRGQRIKYAIQGGLDNQILSNQVIDLEYIKKSQKALKDSIDMLSKYTHINEDTFGIDQNDIEQKVFKVINSFKLFLNTIKECRKYIIEKIEEKLTNKLIEKSLWEVSDDVDILATHHNIDEISIDRYSVSKIKANDIEIIANGSVFVRLQWGSDGDLRRGDGHEMNTTFPYTSIMNATFNKKIEYAKIKVDTFDINTDDWYE